VNTHREPRLEGGGLGLQFVFRQDRYAHEVWLDDGSAWVCVLQSVEGSASDDWPASPPWQSLHVESRPDQRQLALLVGMAGKNHWSASIELDPAKSQIHFDIACRVRGAERGPLASRYRPLGSIGALDAKSATFSIAAAAGKTLRLTLDERFGAMRLESAAGCVNLIAAAQPAAPTETIRWGYTLELGSGVMECLRRNKEDITA
jgi:hypothetical protein